MQSHQLQIILSISIPQAKPSSYNSSRSTESGIHSPRVVAPAVLMLVMRSMTDTHRLACAIELIP